MKIKSKKAEIKRSLSLYALMTPSLILLILFSYLPMYGIIIAFKDYNAVQGIWGSPWTKNFGFSHFIRFVTAYNFTSLIKNTLVLSLYSLVVNAICPVVLALFVNEIQNKAFKRTVQTISYSPYFISCVVMVGMVVSFLNVDRGIVNKVITSFGGKGTMFMSDPDWFVHLYVWTGVWQGVGWASIVYLGCLSNVDPCLHEAAVIDGASRMKRLWHINLPAIIPVFTIPLILSVGNIMNVGFEKSYANGRKPIRKRNNRNLRVQDFASQKAVQLRNGRGAVQCGYQYNFAFYSEFRFQKSRTGIALVKGEIWYRNQEKIRYSI